MTVATADSVSFCEARCTDIKKYTAVKWVPSTDTEMAHECAPEVDETNKGHRRNRKIQKKKLYLFFRLYFAYIVDCCRGGWVYIFLCVWKRWGVHVV